MNLSPDLILSPNSSPSAMLSRGQSDRTTYYTLKYSDFTFGHDKDNAMEYNNFASWFNCYVLLTPALST